MERKTKNSKKNEKKAVFFFKRMNNQADGKENAIKASNQANSSNTSSFETNSLREKRIPGLAPVTRGERSVPFLERPEFSTFKMTNSMQLSVWAIRYRDWDQNTGASQETIPEHTFCRVADELAAVELNYKPTMTREQLYEVAVKFYQVMSNGEFLPAGRTLADVGTGRKTVSNCVVLGIDDKLTSGPRSIMSTLHEAVKLQCQGCGLGFAWHTLRPYGAEVVSGRTQSSGIVSYFNMYASMFETVKQTNSRHGANMGMCLIEHPEVLEFIRAKDTEGGATTVFNITTLLTDEFMRCATEIKHPNFHKPWMCRYKVPARHPSGTGTLKDEQGEEVLEEKLELPFFIVRAKDLFNDKNGRPTSTWGKKARSENALQVGDKYYPKWTANEIMEHIAKHSWSNGEPGFGFYDQVQRTNPLPGLGPIEASNPCGEQFLHDGDVCNLGSLNLYAFCVQNEGQPSYFDWDRLKEVTRIALRMLENVIDITEFDSARVQERILENRRVGLGIMGLADALYAMRMRYGSDEAAKFAKKVMKTITQEAEQMSRELARERGSFPNIHLSVFHESGPMRNAACTTVAPTGTISAFAGVCGGCEPYFAPAYAYQNVLNIGKDKRPLIEEAMKACCRASDIPEMRAMAVDIDYELKIGPHPEFVSWMEEIGMYPHASLCVLARIAFSEKTAAEWLSKLPKKISPSTTLYDGVTQLSSFQPFAALIPKEILDVFVTAQEIPVEEHIKMQAACQKGTNNSISKTLNLPNRATIQDVRATIVLAWRSELKGCTIYRDGSRQEQVLNLNDVLDDGENPEHKSVNRIRFQDLLSNASAEEYRTVFGGTKGELIMVEMTANELVASLRHNIDENQRRSESKVHRDSRRQIDALEKALLGISFGEESTENSSDDERVVSAASSASDTFLTPPRVSVSLLRMSADGSPMCTRSGCGGE